MLKRYAIVAAAVGVFASGLAIGAANPFNPSGTFGQTYAVLYSLGTTPAPLGTAANPLIATCQ